MKPDDQIEPPEPTPEEEWSYYKRINSVNERYAKIYYNFGLVFAVLLLLVVLVLVWTTHQHQQAVNLAGYWKQRAINAENALMSPNNEINQHENFANSNSLPVDISILGERSPIK